MRGRQCNMLSWLVAVLWTECARGFVLRPTTHNGVPLLLPTPRLRHPADQSPPVHNRMPQSKIRHTATYLHMLPTAAAADGVVLVEYQAAAAATTAASALPLALQPVLHQSAFWSTSIMLSIVALLYTWEEAVETARHRLGETLMPVLDSMLAEMGGLGFVGLFLGVVVTGGPLGSVVGDVSERFLGDEEILLESFEFLHTAFFEVGIGFFLISGFTVAKVMAKIESLQDVSKAVFDTDADGKVSLDELADILQVDCLMVDVDGDGSLDEFEIQQAVRAAKKDSIWDEAVMTTTQIRAEALVVRERFVETCRVSPCFRIEDYFGRVFGNNLKKIVEMSPLTWLPLIPALSLGRSVDMSHDVVSAASTNAAISCGEFLGSTPFIAVATFFSFTMVVWSTFNFWKVTKIKEMLVPTLVRDSSSNGKATLLPPRYEDAKLLSEFDSSPFVFGWIESLCGCEPARNEQEQLFGKAGAAGPKMYRNSIKYHSWLVVSQIVFWGTQIVARDINALVQGLQVGNPDLLLPELTVFGFYVSLAVAQLWLAPQTFLNYSLITSIEELANEYAITESCKLAAGENDEPLLGEETSGRALGVKAAS